MVTPFGSKRNGDRQYITLADQVPISSRVMLELANVSPSLYGVKADPLTVLLHVC